METLISNSNTSHSPETTDVHTCNRNSLDSTTIEEALKKWESFKDSDHIDTETINNKITFSLFDDVLIFHYLNNARIKNIIMRYLSRLYERSVVTINRRYQDTQSVSKSEMGLLTRMVLANPEKSKQFGIIYNRKNGVRIEIVNLSEVNYSIIPTVHLNERETRPLELTDNINVTPVLEKDDFRKKSKIHKLKKNEKGNCDQLVSMKRLKRIINLLFPVVSANAIGDSEKNELMKEGRTILENRISEMRSIENRKKIIEEKEGKNYALQKDIN